MADFPAKVDVAVVGGGPAGCAAALTLERYTRKDLGTLLVETTITDPVYYTKPFTISFTARLRPGEELMEYICQENEQDAAHIKGPAGLP